MNFRGKTMNASEYESDDMFDDSMLDTGISGFQIAYGSSNKLAIKQKAKKKLQVKRKIDDLQENRRLARELDSFYGEF